MKQLLDRVMYSFIILSLITFPIETLPGLSDTVRDVLYMSETVIVAFFTLEYFLRLYWAQRKRDYVFSFMGVVDLLAILPFYLFLFMPGSVDARILRAVRLIRLVRVFKLIRYVDAVDRLKRAVQIAREEIIAFLCMAFFLIYVSAAGIWYFEHPAQPEHIESVFDGLWWAIITLTTVGYGDVYPVTIGGKVFTMLILVIGIGIVSIPAGIIASALSKVREE